MGDPITEPTSAGAPLFDEDLLRQTKTTTRFRTGLALFGVLTILAIPIGYGLVSYVKAVAYSELRTSEKANADLWAGLIQELVRRGDSEEQIQQFLQASLENKELDHGFVCILDQDDHVICHPNPELVDLRFVGQLTGQSDDAGVYLTRDVNGAHEIVYVRDIPVPAGWKVAAHLPTNRIDAAMSKLVRSLWMAWAIAVVGVVVLGTIAARFFARDYESLLEQANNRLESIVDQRTAQWKETLGELEARQVDLMEAERLNTAGRFAAEICHELNNPINAIVNLTEIISQDEQVDAVLGEDIQVLQNAARRCLQVSSNMLRLARKSDSPMELVDLNDVATLAIADVSLKTKRAEVKVEVQTLPRPLMVLGSSSRLEQILVNLMENSIQALSAQPTDRGIQLKCLADGQWAVIEVSDNGPGVEPDVAKQIFEPFFTTKEVGKGTGLGLSISTKIASEHHGSLQLVPTDSGACFRLQIPFDVTCDQQVDPLVEPSSQTEQTHWAVD